MRPPPESMKLKGMEEKIPLTTRMACTGVPGDLLLHCFALVVTEDEENKRGNPTQKRTGPKCNDNVEKKKDMAKKKGKQRSRRN